MGHRLSKIVTKTGDAGTTGLADGTRVSKDSLRIAALGDVDELNSMLGVVLAETIPIDITGELIEIQHDLFDCGGEMAIPGYVAVTEAQIERVEARLEAHNSHLSPLKEFILPGGGPAAAACHVARAVCRRAERRCWSLARVETVAPDVLKYLNRLSDLLFVLARVLARHEQGSEVVWRRARK